MNIDCIDEIIDYSYQNEKEYIFLKVITKYRNITYSLGNIVIKDFNVLIVAGHDPHGIFLDATKNIKQFIGYENTSYFNDKYDENSRDSEEDGVLNEFVHEYENNVIYKLHNSNIQQKISKFSFISNNGEKKCHFEKWNNFYMYSKKY